MSPLTVLRNIGCLATCAAGAGQGDAGLVREAALAWEDGRIAWAGPDAQLPSRYRDAESHDAGGRLVVPGLVDCHTHLAFAGWRAEEFERRIRGESYLAIAAAGGGIAATMRATRAATEDALAARSAGFLGAMLELGVTTVECKSGYGLDLESELKLLRVYRRLEPVVAQRLVPTLLAAHVVPPEYRDRRDAYVALVAETIVPEAAAARLARCCDVFVEETAFSPAEARRVLLAGRRAGLAAKVHADQLTAGGGAELAAEVGALSADHLECVGPAGIGALRAAGVVAVSLPIATLYLGQRPMPARTLIEAGVPVAVATDFNPGSAPSYHLPLALTLACTLQCLTPAEALKGATLFAARAVGLEAEVGSIEPGKAADFAVIDAADPNEWLYHFRPNACLETVVAGVTRWRAA
ncbi:MAG TPA: imidazolonepropionase [Gemmatimonadales bacterium]|nr:imidazolonepropionase [Gemmatimonadales bacterium]